MKILNAISSAFLIVTISCHVAGLDAGVALAQSSVDIVATSADNVVIQWDNALLQAIRDTKPGPTIVSRAVAIVHTCIYDAWSVYDSVAESTENGAPRQPVVSRTLENKNKSISYAAYQSLMDLFPQPAEQTKFTKLMSQLGYDPAQQSIDLTTPEGVGRAACTAVLNFRHSDGSNQLGDRHPGSYSDYTGYNAINFPDQIKNPSRWQPLKVPDGKGGFTIQSFTTPQWSRVKTFALPSSDEFRPVKSPARYIVHPKNTKQRLANAEYVKQARELIKISANLTDRQKMIAEYWADGPNSEFPPGHWCLIGQFVSHRDHHTVDEDAKMFFAVGNAVMDAGIAAWDSKRHYDYVRPISAIHYLYNNKIIHAWGGPYLGTKAIHGKDWVPYQAPNVVTPAFPECVSGHSAFSNAAAEVLRHFTGSDAYGASVVFEKGSSRFESGLVPSQPIVLSWKTFTDAASEAGASRLIGGIHFHEGNVSGRAMGRATGKLVWERAEKYFNGKIR